MKPLDQSADLQSYYRDPEVVRAYLARRTAQPFNGFLHRAQVGFLNAALRECRPGETLEIAPGPARLTADIDPQPHLTVLDASPAMLALARQRLRQRQPGCRFLQGDAFRLPFADGRFDFVFTLKLIRHFQLVDRQRLYAEIRRVLRGGGALVLDAQNRAVSQPHREAQGVERYRIYDVLYDLPELVGELEGAGFRVRRVDGIARHFRLQRTMNRLRHVGLAGAARRLIGLVERVPGGSPSTWMVLAEVRS
ncbi:MAG: class I SAM-dependent methyltransferase [Deltaproteobacteria bacterium]|nr:class I SAM-dependent methyltransferase [Deltaproteobacteria bacterium]